MKKLLIIALLFFGCAPLSQSNTTEFFGIAVSDMKKLDKFTITSYSDSAGVSYKHKSSMNNDISAWGEYYDSGIRISITNNTSMPLFSNYFLDEFLISDKSENIYTLTKQEITYDPTGDIYPNHQANFKFLYLPIDREEILMIMVNLGRRNTIVLKRLPKPESVTNP